jgi:hypothetical protein
MKNMEGLIKDRLAYCDNCSGMRPFFEGNIPPVPDSTDKRPGTDYVCAVCYSIIATFEHVTPEEFTTAAQKIEDPQLQQLLKTIEG